VPDLINQSLGRYHILEQLCEGGMAIVYKAYDTRLERDVAIKMIRKGAFPADHLERMLRRFEREAKALARLSHPNIIKILDYGEYEGSPYLVMEYFPGGTLKQKLGKPLPWQEAIQLLLPIAEALDYAHDQNMVHRDVKPANILLTQRGQPMLSDFGIAKLLDLEETHELTGTSVAVGTPEYMAPEQANAKTVDHRADIYSLGIVLYEMVTGRKPFVADTPMAVLIMHARDPLPNPKKFVPDLPNGLEKALLKALAKQPADRYQSMEEFVSALKGLLAGKSASRSAPAPKPPRRETTETATIKDFNVTTQQDFDSPSLVGKGPGVRSKRSWAWIGMTGLCLLGLVGLGLVGLFSFGGKLTTALFATSTPSRTSTPIFTPTATSLPTEIIDSKGWAMRLVPAGTFTMGSNNGEADEQPVHDIYLEAYYIDTYEVTNAFYKACVIAGACSEPKNTDRYNDPNYVYHPVVYVDWNMAVLFCKWRGADLPTESQWEKAARGTDGRTYPWGEGIDYTRANSVNGDTNAVGSFESGKSPYGLYDMIGNVWEWVKDWYLDTYYQNSPAKNPLGPDTGTYRVRRGGTWTDLIIGVRSAYRGWDSPTQSSMYSGFRCARPAP
jgi:serine/threonine protein kinase